MADQDKEIDIPEHPGPPIGSRIRCHMVGHIHNEKQKGKRNTGGH